MSIFTKTKHLDQGAIGLYALHDLPDRQVTLAEGHLSRCRRCQTELRVMEDLVIALRSMNKRVAANQRVA